MSEELGEAIRSGMRATALAEQYAAKLDKMIEYLTWQLSAKSCDLELVSRRCFKQQPLTEADRLLILQAMYFAKHSLAKRDFERDTERHREAMQTLFAIRDELKSE